MDYLVTPWCYGFPTHLSLAGKVGHPSRSAVKFYCPGSSVAERHLGKMEVEGPIPSLGSK